MNFYAKYVKYASQKPWLLIALISITIFVGLPTLKIEVANHPEDWYPGSSHQLEDKKDFVRCFGNDEPMILFLTFPDTCTDDYRLDQIYTISENLKTVYGIENSFSRLNLESARGVVNDKYLEKLNSAYFKAENPNGDILFLKVRKHKNPDVNRPFLLDTMQAKVFDKIPSSIRRDLTGPGVIFTEINEMSTRDTKWLFAACYGLIFLLLWWRLRKVKYLLICSLLVLLAIWPSLALFTYLNIPINLVTLIVPLLFVINYFSFAVHLVAKHTTELNPYLRKKIPPITTSAMTNIIGFGSLMLSDIHVVFQFGLLTSLGILVGLAVLFLIGTPLVVRWIETNKNLEKIDWMNRLLDGFYKRLSTPWAIVLTIVLVGWMAAGIFVVPIDLFGKEDKILVDTNTIGFIKPENHVRQSKEYIEANYGTVNLVELLVHKRDNTEISVGDMAKVAEVRKELQKLPFIASVITHDVWKPFINELRMSSPEQADKLSQGYLAKDKSKARITIRIPSGTVKEMEKNLIQVQAVVDKTLGNGTLYARQMGFIPAFIEQTNMVVDEMLESLMVAVALIMLVMSVFVRNFKIGAIATIVSIFPLCAVALLMKWLDIPFDVATSVIFSVVVGMVADDALHIIWAFKSNLHLRSSYSTNILFADSVRNIVHPCTATSIMFAIGFSVLMGSEISLIVDLGILSASAIVFSWFAHFFFFPAVLRLFYPDKKK
jgi:predicted RND superfamily exporter protein